MKITANMTAFATRRNMELESTYNEDVNREVLRVWQGYGDEMSEPVVQFIIGNDGKMSLYPYTDQRGEDWPACVTSWDELKNVIKYAHEVAV